MCSPRRILFTQHGSGKPKGWTPMHYGVSPFSLLVLENHRLSQVGRVPQGSLSPASGSTEHLPKITICLRALPRHFLNSISLGLWPLSWAACSTYLFILCVLMPASIWAASQTKSHSSVQRYRDKVLWKAALKHQSPSCWDLGICLALTLMARK